jgi:hypothetical protein
MRTLTNNGKPTAGVLGEQTAYELWTALKDKLEQAAVNKNWLKFGQLLVEAEEITARGKLSNLHLAVFFDDEHLT